MCVCESIELASAAWRGDGAHVTLASNTCTARCRGAGCHQLPPNVSVQRQAAAAPPGGQFDSKQQVKTLVSDSMSLVAALGF